MGAALALALIATATAGYLLANVLKSGGGSDKIDRLIVVALLVVAMIQTFLWRKKSEPPKWMEKLEHASLRFTFTLGFLLLGFFPADIVTAPGVGAHPNQGDAWVGVLPFIGFTLLLLAAPALCIVVLGSATGWTTIHGSSARSPSSSLIVLAG